MAAVPHVLVLTTLPMVRSASRAAVGIARSDGWPITVVVADDRFGVVRLPDVDVRSASWLAAQLPPGELARLAMLHEADALLRAVRPFVVRALADEFSSTIVSVPDDAEVTASLAVLAEAAQRCGAAVVATRTTPVPNDGRLPDGVDFDRVGRLDQELFAVSAGAERFVDDWIAAVTRSPHVDADRLDPTDRPVMDELAALHGACVLRDAHLATSYRNADEPDREHSTLVRFPGFDPTRPWVLSDLAGELPRVMLSAHAWLGDRCRTRAAALAGAPHAFGFGELANGVAIDAAMRRAHRTALRLAEADGRADDVPPNPFGGASSAQVLDWFAACDEGRSTSRYLHALHAIRADLGARFADPEDSSFRAWAAIDGRVAGLVPELIPPPEAEPAPVEGPHVGAPDGVNVIGLLRGELGVGEAARQLLRAVEASGVAYAVVVDDASVHRQHHPVDVPDAAPRYAIDVIARNADAVSQVLHRVRASARDRRYTIGLWFWEVERFPDRLRQGLDDVDEVWVATEHVRAAIAAATDKPVRLIPLPLPLRTRADEVRTSDRFTVLYSFDYASVAERKNPWGVVEAYRRAFPVEGVALPDGRVPRLVLKSISEDHFATEREHLLFAIGSRSDIELREGFIDAAANAALLAGADCYVSLHRAEGWGLTLAEAMAAGVPCVATAYSGNLSFMTEANSWLVPCELVPIPDTVREYAGCGRWAEPDIDAAAAAIHAIAHDTSSAQVRAGRGARDVARLADPTPAAAFVQARIAELTTSVASNPEPRDVASCDATGKDSAMLDSVEATPPPDLLDSHPGLGPVVLSPPPSPPPSPTGVRGRVHQQVERAIRFETDHRDQRDHQRAAELVAALSETRRAVRDLTVHQRADQQTLTDAIAATAAHVAAIQQGHDALHQAVTDLGRTVHDDHVLLGDVRDRLTLIESRLDRLTATLETFAEGRTRDS